VQRAAFYRNEPNYGDHWKRHKTVALSVKDGDILWIRFMSGEIMMRGRAMKWSAARIPPRPAPPRVHDFEPPALRPVRTWSVDDGGVDSKGQRRSPGGNPQSGPSYSLACTEEVRLAHGDLTAIV